MTSPVFGASFDSSKICSICVGAPKGNKGLALTECCSKLFHEICLQESRHFQCCQTKKEQEKAATASITIPFPPARLDSNKILPPLPLPVREVAAQSDSIPAIAFGKAEWERYIGDVGEQPPLPENIEEILDQLCPFSNKKTSKAQFWREFKRVRKEWTLVLMPQTVNGLPFNLNTLGQLVQKASGERNSKFRLYWDEIEENFGEQGVEGSYWILMKKNLLKKSIGKNREEQLALIKDDPHYEAPHLLEASTVAFMHYIHSGERLLQKDQYALCNEQVSGQVTFVGCFSSAGLDVFSNQLEGPKMGLSPVRRF